MGNHICFVNSIFNRNGRRAVIEEFSWDSQAKGYLRVMNELTKQ